MKTIKMPTILTIACLLAATLRAQAASPSLPEAEIPFRDYIERVREQNLSYAAEKLNIPIAEAGIVSARVFNDPQLSLGYENNNDWHMQMGQGVSASLSKTFSPGKRRARIDLARSEKELGSALLEDFFRNLRAEATVAYLEALKQGELYRVRQNAYENLRQLADGDSVKFALGKITEVDMIQSRLEAALMRNELTQAGAELRNAYVALSGMLGEAATDTCFRPQGALPLLQRDFGTDALIGLALDNRADLTAALKNVDVARKELTVARRERNVDFDIELGVSHNTTVRNEIAPAPKFTGISAGIAIPLKFSNFNKGSVEAARYRAQQAELLYREAEVQIRAEVMQCHRNYEALCEQVRRYNEGMLAQAKSVVDGRIYSYNRGESPLLEVLTAQRTYDDVRTLYIETLFNHAVSLVELEKSAGIWDIALE